MSCIRASKSTVYQQFRNENLTPEKRRKYRTGHGNYCGLGGAAITTVTENPANGAIPINPGEKNYRNRRRYKSIEAVISSQNYNRWSVFVKRWAITRGVKFPVAMSDPQCLIDYRARDRSLDPRRRPGDDDNDDDNFPPAAPMPPPAAPMPPPAAPMPPPAAPMPPPAAPPAPQPPAEMPPDINEEDMNEFGVFADMYDDMFENPVEIQENIPPPIDDMADVENFLVGPQFHFSPPQNDADPFRGGDEIQFDNTSLELSVDPVINFGEVDMNYETKAKTTILNAYRRSRFLKKRKRNINQTISPLESQMTSSHQRLNELIDEVTEIPQSQEPLFNSHTEEMTRALNSHIQKNFHRDFSFKKFAFRKNLRDETIFEKITESNYNILVKELAKVISKRLQDPNLSIYKKMKIPLFLQMEFSDLVKLFSTKNGPSKDDIQSFFGKLSESIPDSSKKFLAKFTIQFLHSVVKSIHSSILLIHDKFASFFVKAHKMRAILSVKIKNDNSITLQANKNGENIQPITKQISNLIKIGNQKLPPSIRSSIELPTTTVEVPERQSKKQKQKESEDYLDEEINYILRHEEEGVQNRSNRYNPLNTPLKLKNWLLEKLSEADSQIVVSKRYGIFQITTPYISFCHPKFPFDYSKKWFEEIRTRSENPKPFYFLKAECLLFHRLFIRSSDKMIDSISKWILYYKKTPLSPEEEKTEEYIENKIRPYVETYMDENKTHDERTSFENIPDKKFVNAIGYSIVAQEDTEETIKYLNRRIQQHISGEKVVSESNLQSFQEKKNELENELSKPLLKKAKQQSSSPSESSIIDKKIYETIKSDFTDHVNSRDYYKTTIVTFHVPFLQISDTQMRKSISNHITQISKKLYSVQMTEIVRGNSHWIARVQLEFHGDVTLKMYEGKVEQLWITSGFAGFCHELTKLSLPLPSQTTIHSPLSNEVNIRILAYYIFTNINTKTNQKKYKVLIKKYYIEEPEEGRFVAKFVLENSLL